MTKKTPHIRTFLPSELLSPHDRRRLSVSAETCLRTVESYLKGEHVRQLSELRISRALVEMGFGGVIKAARS